MSRQCGPCSLCCHSMGVPTIGKAPDERCAHLRQQRCAVYAERPQECRDFACLWLQGALPNALRPDKIKAVAYMNNSGNIVVFRVMPVHRGAHRKEPLRTYIETIAKSGASVVVSCGGERHVFGPLAARGEDLYVEQEDATLVKITPRRVVQVVGDSGVAL
jgi:hypothetical protein